MYEPLAKRASNVKQNSDIMVSSFSTSKFSIQLSFELRNSQVFCSYTFLSRNLKSNAFLTLCMNSGKLGEEFVDPGSRHHKYRVLVHAFSDSTSSYKGVPGN